MYGKRIGLYRVLVGKPLGIPRRSWKYNTKMSLRGMGWEGIHWIYLAHDRDMRRALVNMVMNPGVPKNAGNFVTSSKQVSLSRRSLLHGVSNKTLIVDKNSLSMWSHFRGNKCMLKMIFYIDLQCNDFTSVLSCRVVSDVKFSSLHCLLIFKIIKPCAAS
jgi:hypothetical protein